MSRAFRIGVGLLIIGLLLGGAQLATRDCPAGPFRLDNCLWLTATQHLGISPQRKGLRAVFLEGVGVALLAGLWLTYRFAFLPAEKSRSGRTQARRDPEAAPEQKDGSCCRRFC
jgi:hypothetical protein